jgi:poly(ADP-ribose) glycohydrolase
VPPASCRAQNKWSFGGLHSFFAEHCGPEERRLFFGSTLPFMIDLVLSTREICPEPIEFLEKQNDKVIMLSQKQIACLLANAFFCTFPGRKCAFFFFFFSFIYD